MTVLEFEVLSKVVLRSERVRRQKETCFFAILIRVSVMWFTRHKEMPISGFLNKQNFDVTEQQGFTAFVQNLQIMKKLKQEQQLDNRSEHFARNTELIY